MDEHKTTGQQLILNFPSRPEFSFSNFVISEGSRFAVDAIRQVCSGAPVPYHSLYLYGGKNLGKTHLEISAGNHIASHSPDKKVLYVSCDEFVRKIERNDPAAHETLAKMLEVDYYQNVMPSHGWNLINAMEHDGVILNYQKEGWVCTLIIQKVLLKTQIEAQIGPK